MYREILDVYRLKGEKSQLLALGPFGLFSSLFSITVKHSLTQTHPYCTGSLTHT